ncbi:MAG TPA: hypothetical protein DIV41_00710, partial [Ruminococcaceae bacterium]|nr:hypothetical protein [Oscillospiraceae bacterium]
FKMQFLNILFHVRLSLFNLDTARKTARLVICWHQYGINYCFNIKTRYGMLYIIVFRVLLFSFKSPAGMAIFL